MDRYWLLTWTTYGTWFPGDERGFVSELRDDQWAKYIANTPGTDCKKNIPALAAFSRRIMKGASVRLTSDQAQVVVAQLRETAQVRGWKLLAAAVMANHVHLVVGVPGDPDPSSLLRDFKSYASRRLNQRWRRPASGTWWTESGSKRKLPNDDAVVAGIGYVRQQEYPLVTWVAEEFAGAGPARSGTASGVAPPHRQADACRSPGEPPLTHREADASRSPASRSPASRLPAFGSPQGVGTLSCSRLKTLLHEFSRLSVALLGDLFLDRYLDIDSALDEPSVETGLTAYQVTRVRNSPGALGTVMNNLAALGVGRLLPVTVIGDDGEGYDLLTQLRRLPVETAGIVQDPSRQTPTYTKPMWQNEGGEWRELNRLDLRTRAALSTATEDTLIARLDEAWSAADGLVVLDQIAAQGQGAVTPRVRAHLLELSRRTPSKLIFIDSRRHIGRFRCGILKPNRDECLRAAQDLGPPGPSHLPHAPEERGDDVAAALALAKQTCQPVYLTQGDQGIRLVRPDGATTHLPAFPVAGPIDIVGAGDSTTAGIVSALLSGGTLEEAGTLGNLVASITIQQIGTTGTATPEHVSARWEEVFGVR
jgi:rfaE bifunctional protein kinase chain/domain